jgi:CRISPR-associated protein Csx16
MLAIFSANSQNTLKGLFAIYSLSFILWEFCMQTIFVSRHSGAIEWVKKQGLTIDEFVTHLDQGIRLDPGDIVIGTLPINLVAQLNEKGVHYVHCALELTPSYRGRELSAADMEHFGGCLRSFHVASVACPLIHHAIKL